MAFYTTEWRFDLTGFMILALKGTDTKSIHLLFFAVKFFCSLYKWLRHGVDFCRIKWKHSNKKKLVTWKAALCRSRYVSLRDMCRSKLCVAWSNIQFPHDILRMVCPILITGHILFVQLHTFLNRETLLKLWSHRRSIYHLFRLRCSRVSRQRASLKLWSESYHVYHSALSIYPTEYLRTHSDHDLGDFILAQRCWQTSQSNGYLLWHTILLHRVVMNQRVQNDAESRTWVFRK